MVWEAHGRDLAAYAAIWRYLLDLDLTDEVTTRALPVDDPLLHLLVNQRAGQPAVHDHIYARLVEVEAALAARRYSAPVDVVLALQIFVNAAVSMRLSRCGALAMGWP